MIETFQCGGQVYILPPATAAQMLQARADRQKIEMGARYLCAESNRAKRKSGMTTAETLNRQRRELRERLA